MIRARNLVANAVRAIIPKPHNGLHGSLRQHWKRTGQDLAEGLDPTVPGKLRIAEHVVSRELGERTQLQNLSEGKLLVLDDVASRMWELFSRLPSREQVVAALESEYGVERRQIEQDIPVLVDDLKTNGIIQAAY